jgi:hypothetical protein
MPFDLPLPRRIKDLWKVKVQDKELLYEEPHVTILKKAKKWRWGLRSRAFLDPKPDPSEVLKEILDLIEANYDELCRQWDARFPSNPVAEEEDDDAN